MKMSKIAVVAICITIVGCSTPFKNPTSSVNVNPATASKVTVQSISNSSMGKMIGNDYSPAAVSINREFIGEFSRNEKSFSYEVNPGPLSMDFCLEGHMPRCLNHKIQVDPNKHYYFEYELVGTYFVIGSGAKRQIRLTQVATYGNPQTPINTAVSQQNSTATPVSTPTQATPSNTPSANTKRNNQSAMEDARKKCIDLGFKSGTESFGSCVLKIAN